jgi:hypothetical protein
MTVDETAAGTPVLTFTQDEYDAYLEREVQRAIGMTRAEFERAYVAGELDDGDPAVDELVGLLRIGQNGHRVSA